MTIILKSLSVVAVMLFVNTQAFAEVETYKIDDSHSFANWTIRHVASKTSGTFSDVSGKIMIDRANLANSSVDAKINLLSVNSSHPKRDAHIQKSDYLDVGKFSEITFVSKKIEVQSTTEGVMTGVLTLHGVAQELTFPFKVLGFGTDPWGGSRSGFEAHTKIKASDFGFTWPLKKDAPVGDEVDITLLIEGVKLPTEKPIK